MDGQVITDIILVILLIGGFVVYFRAKKQLRAGNRSGWLKWAEPYVSVTRPQPSRPQPAVAPAQAPDILGALDDLYREFVDETAAMRREFAEQLDQLRRDMETRIAEQAAGFAAVPHQEAESSPAVPLQPVSPEPEPVRMIEPTPAAEPAAATGIADVPSPLSVQPPAPAAAPAGEQTMAHKRFEILELLVQGMSETEIARKLRIGVTEVNLVQQLLKKPR